MKVSKAYSDFVLRDNFQDARRLFFPYLMDIQYAHLLMLHRIGILSAEDADQLAQAMDRIKEDHIGKVEYDGTFEDLFYYLETLLEESCGADLAGRLHTARSRNDIAVTLYRMRWRQSTLQTLEALFELREVLLDIAVRLIEQAGRREGRGLGHVLAEVSKELCGRSIQYNDRELEKILSPEHFIAVRTTLGRPAPSRIEEVLLKSRERAAHEGKWIQAKKNQLGKYRSALHRRVSRLNKRR